MSTDTEGLERTVAEFNKNAKQGKDPLFHRGEAIYDKAGKGLDFCLGPLEQPPFFGAEIAPGSLGTQGGPRINKNAQVLNPFGQEIPRLYCHGNCSGFGSPGAGYAGGGTSNGPGMTFAYVAGQHASALQPWT